MAERDWITVGGRNRFSKQGRTGVGAPAQPGQSSWPPTQARIDRTLSLVADAQREVAASSFYEGLKVLLSAASLALPAGTSPVLSCGSMVVWGLGSLESSLVHIRYQLALAQLLRGLLGGAGAGVEAFDPVFTPLDRAVLQTLNMQTSGVNLQGRHVARQPTLFYLPHCELELTEQLLSANVAAGTLCNLAILGNSFNLYRERWQLKGRGLRQAQQGGTQQGGGGPPSGEAQRGGRVPASIEAQQGVWGLPSSTAQHWWQMEKCEALAAPLGLLYDLSLCGGVEEVPVDEAGFLVSSAFNDMALHTFPADWRERLSQQRRL